MNYENEIQILGEKITAPILIPYVRWIIDQCRKKKIERLYFLSRDGFILMKIARAICEKLDMKIELRYLYCSRYSLRLPLYHLLGEEGMRQITASACRNTPKAVFGRVGLNAEEMLPVLDSLPIKYEPDAQMNKSEFRNFCEYLKQCELFVSLVNERSKAAFPDAAAYFKQEGLFDNLSWAIADSGWSGSMQRSLRRLLEFSGCKTKMTGFYFGMFDKPVSENDGEYNTFYFDHKSKSSLKAKFCNNLFECMLAADHGMTVGYARENEKMAPILCGCEDKEYTDFIRAHHAGIMKGVSKADISVNFDLENELKAEIKRVQKIMVRPSAKEAEIYGHFLFSDDVSDENSRFLASPDQVKQLKRYSAVRRIYRKFVPDRNPLNKADLFWVYGTAAFVPAAEKLWYRANVLAWERTRHLMRQESSV